MNKFIITQMIINDITFIKVENLKTKQVKKDKNFKYVYKSKIYRYFIETNLNIHDVFKYPYSFDDQMLML